MDKVAFVAHYAYQWYVRHIACFGRWTRKNWYDNFDHTLIAITFYLDDMFQQILGVYEALSICYGIDEQQ